MTTQSAEQSLLHAAWHRDVELARNLLDKGTDPNAGSALQWAAEKGNTEMVELLLEYGADPDAKDDSGWTSLHHAAQGEHDGIVQLLLEYWANPNAKDNRRSTPLHIAAGGKNILVVKVLCDSKADLEARDNTGSSPRFFPIQEDIARLLYDPKTVISQQSDRTELDHTGVKHLDYVSKNTYLCQYQDGNLEKIGQLDLVVYVNIYPKELKMTPTLKEAKEAEPDQKHEVDIIFHVSVNTKSEELQRDVIEKSHYGETDFEFFLNKVRLPILGLNLDSVASIDDVRRIEEVGEVVEHNDVTRRILYIDSQPPRGQIQVPPYQGSGQVIAVADSGLDRGENELLHHAFQNRVIGWFPARNPTQGHNPTQDHTGHGTHVCGSAVGNGQTVNGDQVMGTAPQANLVVQSIWDRASGKPRPPPDLTRLFDLPYQTKAARVHSNSWGGSHSTHDTRGNLIPFRQHMYTASAREIDKFVYEHQDMVICFSAGSNGTRPVAPNTGHIGAQAAAKNCITVGASRILRDPHNLNPGAVADSSSRGPIKNGRCKPDVVAPGTFILSANSYLMQRPPNLVQRARQLDSDRNWCFMSGTSMATPLVAGCAAVLREALTSRYQGISSSAALIKALLINGADILNPTTPNFVPSYDSGFGRVNMANTITIVHCEPGTGFRERELSDGTPLWDEEIEVKPKYTTLKATLVWSDPPGKEIMNKLRLKVGKSKYARSDNTVQQVIWSTISPGKVTLKVGVIGKLDKSPQPFAVVWRTILGCGIPFLGAI